MIDSVFGTSNNYYPQVFLEEWKHVVKEKKMLQYITDDIVISYDDSDGEEILINEILIKKIKYRMCLFLYLSISRVFKLFIKGSYNLHNF